jgi:hypothetical protein
MFIYEGVVVVPQGWNMGRASPMSPSCDLPNIGCGDVFIRLLSLGFTDNLLQVLVRCT